MSTECRCPDCGTFNANPHYICDLCVKRYRQVGAWCEDHGPVIGACLGCRRSLSGTMPVVLRDTVRPTAQEQLDHALWMDSIESTFENHA